MSGAEYLESLCDAREVYIYTEFGARHALYERNYSGNGQIRLDVLNFACAKGHPCIISGSA